MLNIPLKYLDTNRDIHLALLQVCSMPIGAGILSPAMMLFKRLISGLLLQMNRDSINVDNDDLHCETLGPAKVKMIWEKILQTILLF